MRRTLGGALGKDLRHAIELTLYTFASLGDRDRVVEHGIIGVVNVALFFGITLIQAKDVVDQAALSGSWLAAGHFGVVGGDVASRGPRQDVHKGVYVVSIVM